MEQNELKNSASLYLQQHKKQPVAWKIWNMLAFKEARERNVPVLVSIGYSTCHWCHVMAHEVFDDVETAKLMNDNLVCIKVDREENPEVDEIYMEACQAMNGGGGWPLNVFTDADGSPFFATTYLPNDKWNALVNRIIPAYRENRDEFRKFSKNLREALSDSSYFSYQSDSALTWKETLYSTLEKNFDSKNPDFSGVDRYPRFPSHSLYLFLLTLQKIPANINSMLADTLETIQDSGLHDRVGGGFHRYSVDQEWRVPHFEKMLYDNAQMMIVFAMAASRFKRPDFMLTTQRIARYLMRDMAVYENDRLIGFASAEDADDPMGEGSYYSWKESDLTELFDKNTAGILFQEWDLDNDSVNLHGVFPYRIPHPRGSDVFQEYSDVTKIQRRLVWNEIYEVLLKKRQERPRPVRDDKVLTDLNALALAAFSVLYSHNCSYEYSSVIQSLVKLIQSRFKSNYLERLPGKRGHLTDYAYSALALFTAWEATGNEECIKLASQLIKISLNYFYAGNGIVYTSAADENLFLRYEEKYDHAQPSGVSALLLAMVRMTHLGILTGHESIINAIISRRKHQVSSSPTVMASLLIAVNEWENGPLTLHVPETFRDKNPTVVSWVFSEIRLLPDQKKEQFMFCEKTMCQKPEPSEEALNKVLYYAWR